MRSSANEQQLSVPSGAANRPLNFFAFSDAKLRLKDLDPLYTAVWNAKLALPLRQRYTLAEVTFDHAGLAARIAEAKDYWKAFDRAARETLRGAPRRYFRGKVAFAAIENYRSKYRTPEKMISVLRGPFSEVNLYICREFAQYGPCAAFKLADMAERVCENEIDFSQCSVKELCNSKQVRKGFERAAASECYSADETFLSAMLKRKWATRASPRYDRALNAQELESLCCYYSHGITHRGHWPGEDVIGIRKELVGWGDLAQELERRLP